MDANLRVGASCRRSVKHGVLAALLLIVRAAWAAGPAPDTAADFVFRNGLIRTMAKRGEVVDSLVVRGDKIVYTGPYADGKRFIGETTRIIDLEGRLVLPGLTDAHVHPILGGLAHLECDLTDLQNAEQILAKLVRFAADHPDRPWIRGNNFALSAFPHGNPRKELLDRVIPDRPVVVVSSDGHNCWVNSKAFELAGVTSDTADPPKGRIERDPQTNAPTGTLRETAMDLIYKVLPRYTHAQNVEALRRSLQLANSYGLIGLVEASAQPGDVNAYLELEQRNELTAYVNISLACDVAKGVQEADRVIQLNRGLARGRSSASLVRLDQVKIYLDGVVEGRTAALLEPYVGEAHNGIANAEPDTVNAVVAALDRAGLQIHVHAIGDRGIRMALDAFEHARLTNGKREGRHHIAHLQLVHPDDIARFSQLDVTANFQAVWATLDDTYMTELTLPVLGPKRSEWQYPIGTIERAGGRLVFGSDWPVTTLNPFHAAQVALTRRGPDRQKREPWTPQHLIDLESVLAGYTRNGAWITFREAESGILEPGKLANLIVLERDVLSITPFELIDTRVGLTMFRGKVVFER